jgi:hypothetical protein
VIEINRNTDCDRAESIHLTAVIRNAMKPQGLPFVRKSSFGIVLIASDLLE